MEPCLPNRPTLGRTLDGLSDGVLILDQTHRVQLVNDAARQFLGLAIDTPIGKVSLSSLLGSSRTLDATASTKVLVAVRTAIQVAAVHRCTFQLRSGRLIALSVDPISRHRWRLVLKERPSTGAVRRAQRDLLTGLGDRETLAAHLRWTLAKQAATLILVEIDRLKLVKDTLGHSVADLLLAAAADRVRQAVRMADFLARPDGDQFGVVLLDGSDAAAALATRLLDLLSRPYLLLGHLVSTTASAGIAHVEQGFGDAEELVRRASLALRQAKADGTSRARQFNPEMDERAKARSSLEADLRRAVRMQEFALHYQAQYNVPRGAVIGFEALVRWHHPDRGLVPPGEFIPIAEEMGLISQIGSQVLMRACTDAATWSNPLPVAVNVSPLQFERADELVAAVRRALHRSGLPADRLEIEITESALLSAEASTLEILRALRAIGVRVSLDDFGIGYSSLGQLRSFPFDKIKIDRSFVGDVAHDEQASAIIRAISALGESLGMSTIAEGVETEEQARAIVRNGCKEIQGYLISRPVPAEQVEDLIAAYDPSNHRNARAARPRLTPEPPCPPSTVSSIAAACGFPAGAIPLTARYSASLPDLA